MDHAFFVSIWSLLCLGDLFGLLHMQYVPFFPFPLFDPSSWRSTNPVQPLQTVCGLGLGSLGSHLGKKRRVNEPRKPRHNPASRRPRLKTVVSTLQCDRLRRPRLSSLPLGQGPAGVPDLFAWPWPPAPPAAAFARYADFMIFRRSINCIACILGWPVSGQIFHCLSLNTSFHGTHFVSLGLLSFLDLACCLTAACGFVISEISDPTSSLSSCPRLSGLLHTMYGHSRI